MCEPAFWSVCFSWLTRTECLSIRTCRRWCTTLTFVQNVSHFVCLFSFLPDFRIRRRRWRGYQAGDRNQSLCSRICSTFRKRDTAGYISGDLRTISSRVSGDENQIFYGEANPVVFMAPKLVADLGTFPAMFMVTKTGISSQTIMFSKVLWRERNCKLKLKKCKVAKWRNTTI